MACRLNEDISGVDSTVLHLQQIGNSQQETHDNPPTLEHFKIEKINQRKEVQELK